MRTPIFLGLLMIGNSITQDWNCSHQTIFVIFLFLSIFFTMDVFEFIKKIRN